MTDSIMDFIIRRISDGRYIVSVDITVFDKEYAHIFKNKKLALIYMQDNDLSPEDHMIIECESSVPSVITRKDLIDRFNR